MTNIEQAIEAIKKKGRLAKIGIAVAAILLVGPLTFLLANAIFGATLLIVSVALAAAVALFLVNYAPSFIIRMENMKIEQIKAAAKADPIGTAENIYLQNEQELADSKKAIEAFATEVSVFRQKAQAHAKKYPEDIEAISQMNQEADEYQRLLEFREQKWRDAKSDQKLFDRAIQMMKSRFDAATAGIKANKLSEIGKKDIYAKIKLATAYDEVMRRNAQAFSGMRSAMMEVQPSSLAPDTQPGITHQPADVIEMETPRIVNTVSRESTSRREH